MRSNNVRRVLSAAGMGAVALLAACSSTSTQVSDEIATQVQDKLDLSTEPAVTCPDGAEAGKGETFTCTIDLDEGTVPVKVTFEDDTNFTTEVDGAVYTKAELDSALKADLEENGLTLDALDCEGEKLVVFKTDETVTCTATTTEGTDWPVEVGLDDDRNAAVVGTLYERSAVEAFLTEQLGTDVELTSLECGDTDLFQASEDLEIECRASASDGSTATLEVTLGQDGTATLENVVSD